MATFSTTTVSTTIDAPPDRISADLADPRSHPEWGTEFFAGGIEDLGDGTWRTNVPRMGGPVVMRIDGDPSLGVIDLYLAPTGTPFGPPLPIRVVPNGSGADVLFTLTRFPGLSDGDWEDGIASMQRELLNLKERHES